MGLGNESMGVGSKFKEYLKSRTHRRLIRSKPKVPNLKEGNNWCMNEVPMGAWVVLSPQQFKANGSPTKTGLLQGQSLSGISGKMVYLLPKFAFNAVA
jgi:hypothetical protein